MRDKYWGRGEVWGGGGGGTGGGWRLVSRSPDPLPASIAQEAGSGVAQ